MKSFDGWKWEAGERVRPLTADEVQEAAEEMVDEWLAALGIDTENEDVQVEVGALCSGFAVELEEISDSFLPQV